MPASSFSSHTSDLDEARALCHRYYYPITLDPLRGNSRLAFSFRVMELGPVTIGDLRYGCDMRVTCGDLVTSYHVNIPFSGQLDSRHRGLDVTADPGRAAVYQPVGETVLRRWSGDCRQLCLKIDRVALENYVEAALGRPIRGPLDLGASMDNGGDRT